MSTRFFYTAVFATRLPAGIGTTIQQADRAGGIMSRLRINVTDIGLDYPDVVSPDDLRQMLGLKSRKTIDTWIAAGRLDGCFRRRGKRNLIVKTLALNAIFNGASWS